MGWGALHRACISLFFILIFTIAIINIISRRLLSPLAWEGRGGEWGKSGSEGIISEGSSDWLSVLFHELMTRSLYIKPHCNDHPTIKDLVQASSK